MMQISQASSCAYCDSDAGLPVQGQLMYLQFCNNSSSVHELKSIFKSLLQKSSNSKEEIKLVDYPQPSNGL
jgi:hypothetical protein